MVQTLMDRDHLHDPRVREAMLSVPREAFLDHDRATEAYEDRPTWIGWGQTISAPHMVAIMCENLGLARGQRVLEVGTGSGYHAAVTAKLIEPGGEVWTIEYLAPLAERARKSLSRARVPNAHVIVGDGGRGDPDHAPFDRIYLTCSAPKMPPLLKNQLAPGGWILAPIGDLPSRLVRARKGDDDDWFEEDLGACAFVPLRGEFGVA